MYWPKDETALIAAASAAVAAALLAAAVIALFGSDAWTAFPNRFVVHSKL